MVRPNENNTYINKEYTCGGCHGRKFFMFEYRGKQVRKECEECGGRGKIIRRVRVRVNK